MKDFLSTGCQRTKICAEFLGNSVENCKCKCELFKINFKNTHYKKVVNRRIFNGNHLQTRDFGHIFDGINYRFEIGSHNVRKEDAAVGSDQNETDKAPCASDDANSQFMTWAKSI